MAEFGKRPSFGEMLLQHVIVFLICIAFPGLLTLMVPATWITFSRTEEVPSCITRTCVFFVVPYKVQRIAEVTKIGHRERSGRTERKRQFGRTTNESVHVDGEGWLQIYGRENEEIEVSVSPASLDNVVKRSNQFLDSNQKGTMTVFAIANWKFGAIMGGVLTSFTALYVVGYSLAILNFIFLKLRQLVV